MQGPPVMVPDGAGGAIVAWQDARVSATDVYAQHVSAAGAALWTANGLPICTADTTQRNVQILPAPDGGAIVSWLDDRSAPAKSVYAQRVQGDGSLSWAANGRRLFGTPAFIDQYGLAAGAGDTALVYWSTSEFDGGDVFAQKFDGAGNTLWPAPGATVCRGPGGQNACTGVGDGSGGLLVAYRDNRNASDASLYANRLWPDGTQGAVTLGVGDPPARTLAMRGVPNPARGAHRFEWARPVDAGARASVFDVSGRRRATHSLVAGQTAWIWDGRDDDGRMAEPGLYLVRIDDRSQALAARVVRVR